MPLCAYVVNWPWLERVLRWADGLLSRHWGWVLLVLAVWTFGALAPVAWVSRRRWFRAIALTTAVVNVAVLLHTHGLERFGALLADNRVYALSPNIMVSTGQLGWLMLFLVLVFHYRSLERLNARRNLPDIAVDQLVDEHGTRQPGLEALLQDAIGRASPHTAARYPGAGVEYFRDFVDKSGIDPSWWLAKLGAWFLKIAFPPRTLKVSGALVPEKKAPPSANPGGPNGEAGEPGGVTITVEEARSGTVVLSRTVRHATLQDAIEQAGYLVAGYATHNCPTLPKWAYWSEETESSAFIEYWRGVREHKTDRESLERAVTSLERAARESQSSVLPRLQLAVVLEAKQDLVRAIEIYVCIASRYPLLLDARYRLAILLGKADEWLKRVRDDEVVQRRLAQALETEVLGMDAQRAFPVRRSDQDRDDWAREVRRYAYAQSTDLLERLIRDFRWLRIAGWCLRRTADRRILAPRYLWNGSRRAAARAAMKTAQCCTRLLALQNAPGDHARPAEEVKRIKAAALEAIAGREDERTRAERGWWGLPHYNMACFYAILLRRATPMGEEDAGDEKYVKQAMHHLDVAALDPKGPFASPSLWWMAVQHDPHLVELRAHERFKNWVARNQLPIDGEGGKPPPPAPPLRSTSRIGPPAHSPR